MGGHRGAVGNSFLRSPECNVKVGSLAYRITHPYRCNLRSQLLTTPLKDKQKQKWRLRGTTVAQSDFRHVTSRATEPTSICIQIRQNTLAVYHCASN